MEIWNLACLIPLIIILVAKSLIGANFSKTGCDASFQTRILDFQQSEKIGRCGGPAAQSQPIGPGLGFCDSYRTTNHNDPGLWNQKPRRFRIVEPGTRNQNDLRLRNQEPKRSRILEPGTKVILGHRTKNRYLKAEPACCWGYRKI